jgi:cytochrome c oxidase assembly factor CtaG
MDTLVRALLSWEWRVDVLLVILTLATLYFLGWRRLRQRQQPLANKWRLASYAGGMLVIAIALMSPIDVLGTQLFWVHMVQHLLLVMVAPPLLFLGSPFPVGVWGLPRTGRLMIGRLLNRRSLLRNGLDRLSSPVIVWFVFVSLLWGWHEPAAYDAALRYEWVHDLEHLCFFGIGMLYWWRLTGAAPFFSRRLSPVQKILYALSVVPPNMIVGVVLSFAGQPTYTHYQTVPRISDLSVLEDQHFGGLIMWIPGSMMYIMVALYYLFRMLDGENKGGESPYLPPVQTEPSQALSDELQGT